MSDGALPDFASAVERIKRRSSPAMGSLPGSEGCMVALDEV